MRVGTSRGGINMYYNQKDHPHACGDKLSSSLKAYYIQGSSPCVWGQEFFMLTLLTTTGIIPMRVGTSRDCA